MFQLRSRHAVQCEGLELIDIKVLLVVVKRKLHLELVALGLVANRLDVFDIIWTFNRTERILRVTQLSVGV